MVKVVTSEEEASIEVIGCASLNLSEGDNEWGLG